MRYFNRYIHATPPRYPSIGNLIIMINALDAWESGVAVPPSHIKGRREWLG